MALIDGEPTAADFETAARIVSRYGKGRTDEQVTVEIHTPGGEVQEIVVTPILPEKVKEEWMV